MASVKKDRAYFAAKMREYRKAHPGKFKAQEKARRLAEPMRWQLKDAKNRAKARGLEFNIAVEDLELPQCCPVFGFELLYSSGRETAHKPNRATLDRVDSTQGYVKGNVRVISWRANKLKADATAKELRAILKYVEEH